MDLAPFLLNDWLESHDNIDFSLGGSTGPRWTLREVLDLGEGGPDLDRITISYAPPAGSDELRAAIAQHHGVNPDWVIVTNGASEAFVVLASTLARSGGNIVLPFPAYPAFSPVTKAAQLNSHYYQLARENGFRMDRDHIGQVADRNTVLVVTNSPHNPTGAVLPHDDARLLAATLGEKGIPLLVDEVFHPVYRSNAQPSAASIPNVIVVGDMSKAMSLPGLRVGWIIDADAQRRQRFITARAYFALSGSPVLEAIAAHALRNRRDILDRVQSIAAANLATLSEFMTRAADVLEWVRPEAGMLAFPWFKDGRNSRPFCERLAARRTLISPGDCFGMPDHMRIGFGSQVDGIEGGLTIMLRELGIA